MIADSYFMLEELVALTLSIIVAMSVVNPALAQEKGTIRGRVLDTSNGRPVGGATAIVQGVPGAHGASDAEGYFTIKSVEPGTYTVKVTAPQHGVSSVTDVVVTPGKETRISTSLNPKTIQSREVIDITADVTQASEATQLLKQKSAAAVSDNIGAESIAKTSDSDAAEVVTRVSAVTVKDGFIIVRGLNERYNTALLNGSRLPSTDPDRRVVPLDLFPADFIESLSVVKGYTPDLPGDWAGALVDIELAPPPEELEGGLGISTSFNTATTFQDFDTYDSTGLDWITLGQDYRDLDTEGTFGLEDTTPRMRALVGSLPNNWNIDNKTAPPDFSIDAYAGGSKGPLSVLLSGLYGFKHRAQRDEIARSFDSQETLTNTADFRYDRSTMEVTVGALMTSELEVAKDHKLNFRGLFNRTADDEVLDGIGTTLDSGDQLVGSTSQIYTVDQLGYGQLSWDSHFDWFDFDFRTGLGYTTRDQPDAKILTRQQNDQFLDSEGNPLFPIVGSDGSTNRSFANLDELLQDYATDITVPFSFGSLGTVRYLDQIRGMFKAGLAYSNRDRDLHQSKWTTNEDFNGFGPETLSAPAEDVLRPEHYQIAGGLRFLEDTDRDSRRFLASHEIAGAYGMLDVNLIPNRLRFIGGSRVEYSYIRAQGSTLQGPFDQIINDLDPLPAASFIVTATDTMNVRGGYGRTVSRPELRELTPAIFPRAIGQRVFQGNPFLVSTNIDNFDVRWEWFFSELELASLSVFYKDIESPIDILAIPGADGIRDFVANTEGGYAYGIEAELRKDFTFLVPLLRGRRGVGFLASYFADLRLNLNGSWVDSESREPIFPPQLPFDGAVTNPVRRLQGQAPFTINAALQYDHYRWGTFRLLYNTIGETLDAVGTKTGTEDTPGAPDIFQQRRDQLDFVWVLEVTPYEQPLKIKFAAENITNDDFTYTQGSNITEQYYTGVTFSVGLSTKF